MRERERESELYWEAKTCRRDCWQVCVSGYVSTGLVYARPRTRPALKKTYADKQARGSGPRACTHITGSPYLVVHAHTLTHILYVSQLRERVACVQEPVPTLKKTHTDL